MKKALLVILLANTIACKKNEATPCYTLQSEKVITYEKESEQFYKHNGQAHIIRSEFEYCLEKGQTLANLLKGMMADSSYKINGICVTYTVAKKQKLK